MEKKPNLGIPVAIVIAGVVVAGAIVFSTINAPATSKSPLTASVLLAAKDLNLNEKKFQKCLDEKTMAEVVSKQHDIGKELGVTGTPHSIIVLKNGAYFTINGAYPASAVELSISAALAGVPTNKIQGFLDLLAEQNVSEETITLYIAKEFTPATTAYEKNGSKVNISTQPAANEQVLAQDKKDLINSVGHVLGDSNAPIIVAEYSDPECPFCARFHTTMEQVFEKYGKNGNISWRYTHFFPFDGSPTTHVNSRAYAEAVECAGDIGGEDAYWSLLKTLISKAGQ
jgi:protein-disulfide isomerase